MVDTHEEKKASLLKYLDNIEKSIVTKEGKESFDHIVSDINVYLEIDQKVIDLGATVDVELCKQA